MKAVNVLAPDVGMARACAALRVHRTGVDRDDARGYMTPAAVHHGQAQALYKQRVDTLDAAFAAHPKRFKRNCPQPPKLPVAAWINPPKKESDFSKKPLDCTLN